MIMMMVVVMVVVVWLATAPRTHSSMHLHACPPSDEIYGMFNEPIRKQSFQVLFDCLDTAGKRHNERVPYRACDRSGECCQRSVLQRLG